MIRKLLSVVLACVSIVGYADVSDIYGSAYNAETNEIIPSFEVVFLQNDSIMYEQQTDEAYYMIMEMEEGEYTMEVSAFGYELFKTTLNHTKRENVDVKLTPRKIIELDGVEVVADKSMMVTYTATGEVYYLSKDAKGRGNPFMALQEIPVIFSDPNNKSVTGPDGSTPLILVDGKEVNTGIAPIDSHRIEAVEVITSPSSKYVHQGYSCVINIKLKELLQPYVWVELDAYGKVPLNFGKGEGYFEVGSPTFGVYGHLSGAFTKKESVSEFNEQTDFYTRDYKKTYQTVFW